MYFGIKPKTNVEVFITSITPTATIPPQKSNTDNAQTNKQKTGKGENQYMMPETFYRTGIHNIDHATFGGIICPSDFNTGCRGKNMNGSAIARRIVNDWKFDSQCRTNKENNMKENRRNQND